MKSKFALAVIPALLVLSLTTQGCGRERNNMSGNDASGEDSPLVAFCRSINYSDTASLHDKKMMMEIIGTVIRLLPQSDSISTKVGLGILFDGMRNDPKAITATYNLGGEYLDNPASPMRNEELFIRFLTNLLATDSLPEAIEMRAANRLRITMLNRPGTLATNFRYKDRDGNEGSLHGLEAEMTMLIFYDPECTHCSDILTAIARDVRINTAVDENNLTVLAVYAEGKKDIWNKTKGQMPDNWKVGFDLSDIVDNELYDLNAMPIVYLLDSVKRVILKDPNLGSDWTKMLPRSSVKDTTLSIMVR